MRDFSDELKDLRRRLGEAEGYLKISAGRARLAELEMEVARPDLWDDQELAKKVNAEYANVKADVDTFDALNRELEDAEVLHEMARELDDETQEGDIAGACASVNQQLRQLDLRSLFTGEHDENDVICEIQAGEGGADAQDWANMLLRMYTRWAERRGMKVEVLEMHDGEEAGIKSATLLVKGHNAYGWLKTESGVHRLVRISPFDSNARRHTSFASIWVYPVIDDSIEIDVSEADVRIDTYRASGAGGQHVNTTDSAVRITHIASGIVVACQKERSQHKNRATAWDMLRSRLYEEELKKREEAANATEASKTDIGWGHQIRSYVLQPYQLVKDLRTGVESTSPQSVLDGDLDDFMQAALSARIEGGDSQPVADLE